MSYPTVAEILELVARETRVSILDLKSNRRSRAISHPRMLAMWLARHTTPESLPQIGKAMGDKDHTSVMYACRKIDELRLKYPSQKALSDRLLAVCETFHNEKTTPAIHRQMAT